MLYRTKRFSDNIPAMINLLLLLSLGGGLLAAVQALLIVLQGDILCLNDGCEIVEKLTTVPPIAFNIAGSLYFMTVFLALWQGARGVLGWLNLARLLLVAGMAAEGVLVGFQHYVAGVFCSYCLVIFSIVALLNILMGWRQLLVATAVFGAVLTAFASLQFTPSTEADGVVLEKGIYGRLENQQSANQLYLFFSSTCPHCEEVIETIDSGFDCSLNFNPIDSLAVSPMDELVRTPEYSPGINRRFLKNLGISEIPALAVKGNEELRILKGKQLIQDYLDAYCRGGGVSGEMTSEFSEMPDQGPGFPYFSSSSQEEDACSVEVDCEEVPAEGADQ